MLRIIFGVVLEATENLLATAANEELAWDRIRVSLRENLQGIGHAFTSLCALIHLLLFVCL